MQHNLCKTHRAQQFTWGLQGRNVARFDSEQVIISHRTNNLSNPTLRLPTNPVLSLFSSQPNKYTGNSTAKCIYLQNKARLSVNAYSNYSKVGEITLCWRHRLLFPRSWVPSHLHTGSQLPIIPILVDLNILLASMGTAHAYGKCTPMKVRHS